MSATTAQTTRYWFDPFERMMRSQSADQGAQSYSYDGLDRRDTKCKGDDPKSCPAGARTDYSYVGLSQNLSGQKPDGTTSADMSMGWDYSSSGEPMGMSSKPATQTAGSPVKYMSYAKDANGSISGLEGADGTIKAQDRYHYDPYGSLQDTSGTKPAGDPAASAEKTLTGDAQNNPMRFEGFYYDSGVKTYDMQARQYRPDTGRFLSQDRYEASQGDLNLQADPLTQNRYAFAGGNPTNNIEFDGHRGFGSFNWNRILCSIGASSCQHHRSSGSSTTSSSAPSNSSARQSASGGFLPTIAGLTASRDGSASIRYGGAKKAGTLPGGDESPPAALFGILGQGADQLSEFGAALGPAAPEATGTFKGVGVFARGIAQRFARLGKAAEEAGGAAKGVTAAEQGAISVPRHLERDANVDPTAPPPRPTAGRTVSRTPDQNNFAQRRVAEVRASGARDIRVDQQQVDASPDCASGGVDVSGCACLGV